MLMILQTCSDNSIRHVDGRARNQSNRSWIATEWNGRDNIEKALPRLEHLFCAKIETIAFWSQSQFSMLAIEKLNTEIFFKLREVPTQG
jgi:hypothetical protein